LILRKPWAFRLKFTVRLRLLVVRLVRRLLVICIRLPPRPNRRREFLAQKLLCLGHSALLWLAQLRANKRLRKLREPLLLRLWALRLRAQAAGPSHSPKS
jgi:hypothetical protein